MSSNLPMAGSETKSPEKSGGPIRVLEVVEAAEGGTATHVIALATGLDRARFDVTIVYSTRRARGFVEKLKAGDGPARKTIGLPILRRPAPISDLINLIRLYRLMRRGKYDVVHCHSTKAGLLGRLAARLAKIPRIIYTPHGFWFWGQRGLMRWVGVKAERLTAHWCDLIVVVSSAEKQLADKFGIKGRQGIVEIPNGIVPRDAKREDAEAFRKQFGIAPEAPTIAAIGRLDRQKGFDRFLTAAHDIALRKPDVRFVIAGTGPLEKKLRRQAVRTGLGKSLIFAGHLDDPAPLYGAADIIVVPSRWESCSYVILEAAAMARPIAAFESAGGKGMTAAVPGDDPVLLAGTILELLTSPVFRDEQGRRARQFVLTHHRLDTMIEQIEQLYTKP